MPLNYSKQTLDRVKALGINSENEFNAVLDFFENRSKNEPKITEANTELVSKISELNFENSKLKLDLENVNEKFRKLSDEYTKISESIPEESSESISKNSEIISELCNEFSVTNPDELAEAILDKLRKVSGENRKLSEELEKKNSENVPVTPPDFLDSFSPFTRRLLDLTAERLSTKFERKVSPKNIVTDIFLRYTIERNAEWFYPWVISKNELVQIAHEFNDKITSYNQIKTIIGK